MHKKVGLTLLLFFQAVAFASSYYHYDLDSLTAKYGIEVSAKSASIYYFIDNGLVKEIEKGESEKIYLKENNKKARLVSEWPIFPSQVKKLKVAHEQSKVGSLRNVGVERALSMPYNLALIMIFLIVFLGLIKLFFPDIFYTYIMPVTTYSATKESMRQMNFRNVMIPGVFFVFCFSVAALMYDFPAQERNVWFNILLIIALMLLKIVVSKVICELLDLSIFYKFHLLEFLKFGIILSIAFFLTQIIVTFNSWNYPVIYEISLLLYVLIWFIRLTVIFYREGKRDFIYFFSYICGTEGLPILILLIFWR